MVFALLSAVVFYPVPAPADSSREARGEYILHLSGCVHCHTAEDGEPLAGGRALHTPFGTFYTPNITPHPTAGIGRWSEDEFVAALHEGVAPDGSSYYPAFPYTSYTRMTSADARTLYAYLMSLPVSPARNREHELAWFLRWRVAATVWQWLFFERSEFQALPRQSAIWNRGAYIAEALGHCGECHTPRNLLGAPVAELAYAGNKDGPDGEKVPNITRHSQSGIGDWTAADIGNFLQYGELPDGEYAAGSMEPVSEGLARLTTDDRGALTEFLLSLTPVDNRVDR
jgi:mono/diheme cytochrome c family protein